MDNIDNNQPVKKDMGDDWNEKFSKILQDIDDCHSRLSTTLTNTIEYILYCRLLDDRIETAFAKLSAKINKEEKEKYDKLIEGLSSIQLTKMDYIKGPGFNYNIKPNQVILDDNVKKYLGIINKLEIHLNFCMERLGLTNQNKRRKI